MSKVARYLIVVLVCVAVVSIGGCVGGRPRLRLGSFPTSTPGTTFVNADELGQHSYSFSPFEKNGITYTCRGGHIDIVHLRIGADNTKYITNKLYDGLLRDQREFTFVLTGDRSKHHVRISYPENWNQLQKEPIAREVSLKLGPYLAYSATTWHEMPTWFGFSTMFAIPEFSSAFSWEDTYSNLLGIHIAVKAMRDTEHDYNQAMTLAMRRELEDLGGQSATVAKSAAQKVRGQWFSGNIAVNMKKRNLDIGLDDGSITPMIVPGLCPQARPKLYSVPNQDVSKYGFSMQYQIFPKEFERGKILKIVYPDGEGKTIKPDIHFAPIMAHIRKVAIKKYGSEVATAYDPDKATEQKPVRIAEATIAKKTEPIHTVALSRTKKHDYVQELWELGVEKQGPMTR